MRRQQPIVERFVERVFGQRIVNNVERGFYVECMIELALRARDPDWRLLSTWDAWDVEHAANKARLEIKQSAALNPWTPRTPIPKPAKPVFGIKPVKGYWREKEGWLPLRPPQRLADVYIFAWHRRRTGTSQISNVQTNGGSSWWPSVICRRMNHSRSPLASVR